MIRMFCLVIYGKLVGHIKAWIELPIFDYNRSKHIYLMIRFMRRHQMEMFSALLAICAGNSPVPGEFPQQK